MCSQRQHEYQFARHIRHVSPRRCPPRHLALADLATVSTRPQYRRRLVNWSFVRPSRLSDQFESELASPGWRIRWKMKLRSAIPAAMYLLLNGAGLD